jgi:hypothetical protein
VPSHCLYSYSSPRVQLTTRPSPPRRAAGSVCLSGFLAWTKDLESHGDARHGSDLHEPTNPTMASWPTGVLPRNSQIVPIDLDNDDHREWRLCRVVVVRGLPHGLLDLRAVGFHSPEPSSLVVAQRRPSSWWRPAGRPGARWPWRVPRFTGYSQSRSHSSETGCRVRSDGSGDDFTLFFAFTRECADAESLCMDDNGTV